ncbi:MAG: MFS transporter, partial [Terriglobales bacterium]
PMIVYLAVIAVVSLAVFFWHELRVKKPLVQLNLLKRRNFGFGSVINTLLGMGLYSSVYLIPVYLAQTQGYNALEIGQTMMWLGIPQLFIIPLVPTLMKKFDPRLLVAVGIALFASSSLMNCFMTHDNAGPQLVVSLLVRALGQPLIMVPLSTLATSGIEVEQSGAASALFNMMRNFGGSVGVAMLSTFLTRREQFHSSRIGESIYASSHAVQERINALTQFMITRGADLVTAHDQAVKMLDNIVRKESYIMAFNDAFLLLGVSILLGVFVVFLLQKPQGAGSAAVH